MRDCLLRKGLVLATIILFIGMSVIPSTAVNTMEKTSMPTNRGNTLYVGGSGEGNYTRIRDAIDDAVDGDTVFVYDDSSPYFGGVFINKMINLIGENRDTTVIEGGSQLIVEITADNVNICGFTIRYGEGACIYITSNYNTITDNNISDNSWGIGIMNSSSNTITGNNIFNTYILGIYLWFSSNNTIMNNNIMNDYFNGISLDFSSNNTITGNNITSKTMNGIHLYDSSNNTITGNNISNNGHGIGLASTSNNNIITGNTITWNNRDGIKLLSFSNYNIIYHNNFINNTRNVNDECNNTWDDGKYGNYWSDYKEKYPDAKPRLLKPWMWNTPYEIPGGDNKYRCPLIKQWPYSKPRTISRNTASYSSYLLRFLEQFPILQKILIFIL